MSAFENTAEKVAATSFIPWQDIEGKRVVITGATGLIGRTLAASLLAHNRYAGREPITVVAPVRRPERLRELFGDSDNLVSLPWDATAQDCVHVEDVDYIVHCAAPTASRFFVEHPVETIESILNGTYTMLELARSTGARMVYLSSMEVYGEGAAEPLEETAGGAMDAMHVRNSYPEAKQMAESMCAAYAQEYDLAICVARLAQCFGPGVAYDDRRVFAEFARSCVEGRDIVLLTEGNKRNMYVSTQDAATALLLLMVSGASGEAYNVANKDTVTSIKEMAESVVREFGKERSRVRVKVDPKAANAYRPGDILLMDTKKLTSLVVCCT
jgi:nucleoside-diphosphate-sugar epimerase